jgi:uncharacterized phosphosugar-binding protein
MPGLRRVYRDQIVGILDKVLDTEAAALDAARDAVVAALAADRLVYVAGSGHSHLLAEEAFYRAGGIAAAQAILDPDLMLHLGARRSTLIEREEGRAEKVLADYPIGPGDVVFVASNSGRNAYPIELALGAKTRGATTIALTSRAHASATTSRHQSGKRLFEVTDIVIDNGGVYGDAGLPVGAGEVSMGPSSTIVGAFILNAIFAEAVDKLATMGIIADVYQSANKQGAETLAEAVIERWQTRIRGL